MPAIALRAQLTYGESEVSPVGGKSLLVLVVVVLEWQYVLAPTAQVGRLEKSCDAARWRREESPTAASDRKRILAGFRVMRSYYRVGSTSV